MITRTLLLRLANSKKMEAWVRRSGPAMAVARRFVAGETIESAVEAVRTLNAEGAAASLDFLGESVTTKADVDATVATYLRLFDAIRSNKLDANVLDANKLVTNKSDANKPDANVHEANVHEANVHDTTKPDVNKFDANVSLKLTALGLDIDEDLCRANLLTLLKAAGPDLFVRIDMEGSAYTQRTLDLFYSIWCGAEQVRNVGIVLQSYLKRTEGDVGRAIDGGVRVRICKGAYDEPATVAFAAKQDVDKSYIRCAERLLSEGVYPGIATHDPHMIEAVRRYVLANGIDHDRFEFQMLYGIRRDLQRSLTKDGCRLRVYVPFGTHWYPYFMRRLAERPANLWFVLKNTLRQ